jgi:hypothetical protein
MQLRDEDMDKLQTLLSGSEKEQRGRPRMDKNEKRENHKRRKAWRRQAETGYR